MSIALRLALVMSIVAAHLADAIPTVGSDEKVTQQVVVDVVVADSNNQPVKGLGPLDFQLFEDHKVQKILSFEVHEQQAATETSKLPESTQNTFTNDAASETGPINVILLDQLATSIEDQKLAKDELIAYLDEKPPGSRFAIFTYRKNRDTLCIPCDGLRMLQGITNNKQLLIGALQSTEAQEQDPTSRVFVGSEIEDTSMHALAELGDFLKGLPGRKELIWLSDNFDAGPVAQRGDVWFGLSSVAGKM